METVSPLIHSQITLDTNPIVQPSFVKNADEKQAFSKTEIEDIVKKLNSALDPFKTSLRFGFDNSSDEFFISVVETKTNKIIRRFPAEHGNLILPKLETLKGLIFDQKV